MIGKPDKPLLKADLFPMMKKDITKRDTSVDASSCKHT